MFFFVLLLACLLRYNDEHLISLEDSYMVNTF